MSPNNLPHLALIPVPAPHLPIAYFRPLDPVISRHEILERNSADGHPLFVWFVPAWKRRLVLHAGLDVPGHGLAWSKGRKISGGFADVEFPEHETVCIICGQDGLRGERAEAVIAVSGGLVS